MSLLEYPSFRRARLVHGLSVIVAMSLAAVSPAPAAAGVYGALETYLPGDADKPIKEGLVRAAEGLTGKGYSVATTLKTVPAFGGRLGLRRSVSDNFDVGLSVGYIRGPNSKGEIVLTSPTLTGSMAYRRELQFIRALVEPGLVLPFSGGDSALHLSGGAGVAQGRSEETFVCRGTACVKDGSTLKGKATWTGFTWEASTYVSIRQFTAGLRYAGFPKLKGNDESTGFDWKTVAFFLGFRF